MNVSYYIIIIILTSGAFLSVKAGKLTIFAGCTGWVIGIVVFSGSGYTGVIMLSAFFVLGTAATSWKMKWKQHFGFAEKEKGRRTAGQVIANAGVAGMLSLLICLFPIYENLFIVMMAGSLSSATADTLSSELGNVYGQKFYNIVSLKRDVRGSNGVVSVEGSLLGVTGSAVIALIYAFSFGFDYNVWLIIIAGTIGNIADSVMGATVERKRWLNNNAVNLLNTLIASLAVMLLKF